MSSDDARLLVGGLNRPQRVLRSDCRDAAISTESLVVEQRLCGCEPTHLPDLIRDEPRAHLLFFLLFFCFFFFFFFFLFMLLRFLRCLCLRLILSI
jgi:hypothetical protein